jgi:SAM-dependent methyltransferase
MSDPESRLLQSQKTFYDLRASDYLDESKPDRRVSGAMPGELARSLVQEFALRGDVLELACGDGRFTRELSRYAEHLVAVDASPRMLARNRERLEHATVASIEYVEGDVFSWEPGRSFDAVFFGFWLSHVPPAAFEAFWDRVRACLRPNGRVAFIDEDDRADEVRDARVVDGVPIATRTLTDGRTFDIVKVFYEANDLQRQLTALGWNIQVRRAGETFYCGIGPPSEESHPGRR